VLTAIMLAIYIVFNIACISYYWRKAHDEFNWFFHLLVPAVGTLLFIPVLLTAVGIGKQFLSFVSPLPYPISLAGPIIAVWFAIGAGYLIYLYRQAPSRLDGMKQVFDDSDELVHV
jgi:hypothetical protein